MVRSSPDQWSLHLFLALCRRYGMRPYRYSRQRRNTVMVRAPKRFLDQVLWPEFSELDQALQAYLSSSDATRNPRGGLCRRERGAGDFRGAAAELMEDAVRPQGCLSFVGLCVPKTLSSGGAARWIADNYETVRTEPGAAQRRKRCRDCPLARIPDRFS